MSKWTSREYVLGEAMYNLQRKEPFWADFAVMLQIQWTKHIDTAAVCRAPDGINVSLLLNEAFIMLIGSPPTPKYKDYPCSVCIHELNA